MGAGRPPLEKLMRNLGRFGLDTEKGLRYIKVISLVSHHIPIIHSGIIKDAQHGDALPGANIVLAETGSRPMHASQQWT